MGHLLKAIVVFRIDVIDIQAKFKLSQKQDASNRENVIAQLQSNQGDNGKLIAEYMRLTVAPLSGQGS